MSDAMFNLDYAREMACQTEDVELLARLLSSAVEHVVLLHADIERLRVEKEEASVARDKAEERVRQLEIVVEVAVKLAGGGE